MAHYVLTDIDTVEFDRPIILQGHHNTPAPGLNYRYSVTGPVPVESLMAHIEHSSSYKVKLRSPHEKKILNGSGDLTFMALEAATGDKDSKAQIIQAMHEENEALKRELEELRAAAAAKGAKK